MMREVAPHRAHGCGGWTARAVALLAALGLALAGCQGKLDRPAYPAATASASTPSATAAPVGAWTRVSAGSPAASGAPATLRTRYDISSGQSAKGSTPMFSLRRSDDFGKTWVNLTPPTIAGLNYANGVTYASVTVSPLNPQVAILTLQLPASGCPLPHTSATPDVCQPQYVTQDGGRTWTPLRLPTPGVLGVITLFDGGGKDNITAQGARLYGVVNDAMLASGGAGPPPGRLVASDDGGATWLLDDGALAARNLFIYDYSAPTGGATIFALVGAMDPFLTPGELPPLSLWQSDNGGASWSQAGPLPAAFLERLLAARNPVSGQTTLYAIASDSTNAPLVLYASRDNGAHWTSCSQTPTNPSELLAALPNGGVLLDTASAVEEWDGSVSAPRVVAQPTGLGAGPTTATPQPLPDGSTRLWLIGGDAQGTVYEYTTIKLT